jgi:hypothetical protein
LPLFSNFALKYAVRKVQENQERLALNMTCQYAADVNLLVEDIYIIKTSQKSRNKFRENSVYVSLLKCKTKS